MKGLVFLDCYAAQYEIFEYSRPDTTEILFKSKKLE